MKNSKSLGIEKNIDLGWKYFLARPFTLFGASIWNSWYLSDFMRDNLGMKMKNALYIEKRNNFFVQFRLEKEQEEFQKAYERLATDQKKLKSLLNEGLKSNKAAKKKLSSKKFTSLKTELDFLLHNVFCAGMVAYWASRHFSKESKNDPKLIGLCERLRLDSYYQRLIDEIIVPLAKEKLASMGIDDVSESVKLITLAELLEGDTKKIKKRMNWKQKGFLFVYENMNGKENIRWTKKPQDIISKIEQKSKDEHRIQGKTSFPGRVKGVVRLVLTNEIGNKVFNKGDILVSASTNPALLPLMKKSGAIITDEGGLMCHAAIISRELKIPCIVATKIATKVLKDGDLVEVDATKGMVKILKKK
jgi:phosphohistidine swiveling domain-containing protein